MRTKLEIPKIPIEEGRTYFEKEGIDLTEEETAIVLEFLYTLTRFVFKEYFDIE
ncbi:hypothetical protein HX049_01465 [Myroides odoratimimus]|uniref:hypothetical protein n=1 Tax=Myroides odoratimimus TaxID=76832 RepID=UPI002577AAA2|nr:hypothetical protein [Myroides odoratimimus]MDM1395855.1 hypothetical protein [Myroides odoratimimus]